MTTSSREPRQSRVTLGDRVPYTRTGLIPTLSRTSKLIGLTILGEERYMKARAAYQIKLDNLKRKPLLMVHTMGKVGSTTISASLKASGMKTSVAMYQPHFISEEGMAFAEGLSIEGVGEWEKLSYIDRRFLMRSHLLNAELQRKRAAGERVQVITLVRDPVGTNLSGFFHNHIWWPEKIKAQCAEATDGCLAALERQFFDNYPHDVPDRWFDMELLSNYGIDVFATPFDRESGYQIYRSDFADLLVLKLEKLNQCSAQAFQEFLGLSDFKLTESNKAEDKSYADLYKDFRKQTTLPESYLDRMYASRVAQHFYTAEEIAAFRRKWSSS